MSEDSEMPIWISSHPFGLGPGGGGGGKAGGCGVTSAASEMLKEQGGKMVPLEDPAGAGAEAEPFAHVVGLLCCRALGEWGG